MVGALLLITGVFSVWQILLCNTVNAGYSTTNYVYPPGSLSCKLCNRTTGFDCRYRKLVSIPPLSHHGSLEKLDLSHNKLSYLPDDAFLGLHKLKTLDLSHNVLENITGSPFKDLGCLQELNLGFNRIKSVNNDTFTGLQSLITLNLNYVDSLFDDSPLPVSVYGTPFNGLHSLRNLSIGVDCTIKPVFTGLEKLAKLKVECVIGSYTDPFSDALCSLKSLHTLMLSSEFPTCITNTCLQNIPLKSLHYQTWYYGTPCISYEFLNNLTSLTLQNDRGLYMDTHCTDLIQSLSSIHPTIKNLTIYMTCHVSEFVFDSTTFAPWSNWSSSLRYLDITINLLKIEGSPFALFTNLHKLCLTRLPVFPLETIPTLTLPWDTFNGLDNLQELSLNFNCDVFTKNALFAFNNLTYLELKGDQIQYEVSMLPLLVMSSIRELDLSDNLIGTYPCVSKFPNLKKMNLKNNPLHSYCISPCENSPHLYAIDLTGTSFFNVGANSPLCPQQLEVIYLSNSTIRIDGTVNLAHLQSLYLHHVTDGGTTKLLSSVKQIMVMFSNTPNLTTLDLSSNQINDIDKEDAMFLRNLTYLNLANNKLTTVDNLQYLTKIKTLILNGNRITAVSDVFLLRLSSLFMDLLDLRNNPFECTCATDVFREWILQDDDIYLAADDNGIKYGVYQCLTPVSTKGFSLTEVDLDCRFPLELYLSISIACGFVAILMAISVIRYRWHIQYQLFLLCTRRKRYQHYLDNDYGLDDEEENENGIPRFDAYVAYHEEDEDWVDGELLQNVEEGDERFRLCLRNRDVPAGRLLINAVSMCIQRSRKSLIILTPRFVENNWCYFQLSMAHQRLLEEGRNVLILIILEEIPNDKMTLILRQLFCKVRCLKWPNDGYGQRLFWQRLKEELKIPMPIDRRYHI